MATTLNEKLFDLECRIDGVYPLAVGEGLPEWLDEFVDDSDGASKDVFTRFPPLARLIEDDRIPDQEEVADAIIQSSVITGWVCLLSWCPRKYIDGDIFESGWGWTRRVWVWGATAEEAVAKSLVHANEDHEKARAKALAA